MSDLTRPEPTAKSDLSEDYGDLGERRNKRIRVIAWVTIASLVLVGGGSTVITLLFG